MPRGHSRERALLSGKTLDSDAQTRKLLGSAMFRALINSKLAVRLLSPRRHSGASRNPLWSERKSFPIQQYGKCVKWIPACAGMTEKCSEARRQDLEIFSG
jgi:hypothetical protein